VRKHNERLEKLGRRSNAKFVRRLNEKTRRNWKERGRGRKKKRMKQRLRAVRMLSLPWERRQTLGREVPLLQRVSVRSLLHPLRNLLPQQQRLI
jgi:hypothetical protein